MYASMTRSCASIANSSVMFTLMPSAMSCRTAIAPCVGAGNLDHHVRAIDRLPQPPRLGDRRVASFATPGDTSIET